MKNKQNQPTIVSTYQFVVSNKTSEEFCEVFSIPFKDSNERLELEKAILTGNKRVTERLKSLHTKFLDGKLENTDEIDEYKKYQSVLNNYSPRCITHFISNRDPQYPSTLIKLKEDGPITMNGQQHLYPLHFEKRASGILVFGNFVENVESLENRISAFIQDTAYVRDTWRYMYDPEGNDPDLVLLEHDAETNGDSDGILDTFYPELRNYHRNFQP